MTIVNLSRGAIGPLVRDLQSQLNSVERPLPLLAVDGIFGAKTDAAVRKFQRRACPPDDGIVGPITRAALASALPKPSTRTVGPYQVPAPLHIAQDQTMSCWYASAQMLIQWKRQRTGMTDARHPDPSESPTWSQLYSNNTGITNARIQAFAQDMGFLIIPPMSATSDAILMWLSTFGPLWVNGIAHITVIAGIRGSHEDPELLVLDPARAHERNGSWRSLRQWYALDPVSGRDTSQNVSASFLRLPSP